MSCSPNRGRGILWGSITRVITGDTKNFTIAHMGARIYKSMTAAGPEGVTFDGALRFVGQRPLKQACVVVQSQLSSSDGAVPPGHDGLIDPMQFGFLVLEISCES